MTPIQFTEYLMSGTWDRGCEYQNEDQIWGWRSGVRVGKEYFQYTVFNRTSPVVPEEVISAVRTADKIEYLNDGKTFFATVWSSGNCYMLWHRQKS